MKSIKWVCILTLVLSVVSFGCAANQPKPDVDTGTVKPGGRVTRSGAPLALVGTPIAVGRALPSVPLVDSVTQQPRDLSLERGKVLLLSIVPSIDTKVCEAQTHVLGEEGDRLPDTVERITISRDTPFAHRRFAEAAKLTDIQYLSDYKSADFGRSTGLLLEGPMLLTRAVVIVDKSGIVRYIQVVPEITRIPDMDAAFRIAAELARSDGS